MTTGEALAVCVELNLTHHTPRMVTDRRRSWDASANFFVMASEFREFINIYTRSSHQLVYPL
jgi:hypothetical protein